MWKGSCRGYSLRRNDSSSMTFHGSQDLFHTDDGLPNCQGHVTRQLLCERTRTYNWRKLPMSPEIVKPNLPKRRVKRRGLYSENAGSGSSCDRIPLRRLLGVEGKYPPPTPSAKPCIHDQAKVGGQTSSSQNHKLLGLDKVFHSTPGISPDGGIQRTDL